MEDEPTEEDLYGDNGVEENMACDMAKRVNN